MRIVAVDPSLTGTGIAARTAGEPDLDLVTIVTTPATGCMEERWQRIAGEVFRRLGWVGHGPLALVVEDGVAKAPGNPLDTAGLRAILRYGAYARGIDRVLVPPSNLKQYATGKGNASKQDVLLAAERLLNGQATIRNDNEADALWLLAMTFEAAGVPLVKMPARNRAALDKVHWPQWMKEER